MSSSQANAEYGGESDTGTGGVAVNDKPNPQLQSGIQQLQAKVDEVAGIMKDNVEKVLERGEKLTQLDERAEAMKEGAQMFGKKAGAALKSKFY